MKKEKGIRKGYETKENMKEKEFDREKELQKEKKAIKCQDNRNKNERK